MTTGTKTEAGGQRNKKNKKISGFSVSHSDVDVRIWGYLTIIHGKDPEFYREPVAKFDISKTAEADNRWIAWTVAMNILDLWLPDHFERICSAIDMLPARLDFEVSELAKFQPSDPELASSRTGLSQQLDISSLADERDILDSQLSVRPITPDTTIQTGFSNSKKKKAK